MGNLLDCFSFGAEKEVRQQERWSLEPQMGSRMPTKDEDVAPVILSGQSIEPESSPNPRREP